MVLVYFGNFSNSISATLDTIPHLTCLPHRFIYLFYLGLEFLFLGTTADVFLCLLPSTTYLVRCLAVANNGVFMSPGSWWQNQKLVLNNPVRKGNHWNSLLLQTEWRNGQRSRSLPKQGKKAEPRTFQ